MKTEEEAKQCWCPFVRMTQEERMAPAVNRVVPKDKRFPPHTQNGCQCIASACMAWRKVDQIGITPEGKQVARDMDGRVRWVDRGFCGLAGKVSP